MQTTSKLIRCEFLLSYVGQYEIDLIINPIVVRLKLPPHMKIHPTFHASQLKPVSTSPLPLSDVALPPPAHYQHSSSLYIRPLLDLCQTRSANAIRHSKIMMVTSVQLLQWFGKNTA